VWRAVFQRAVRPALRAVVLPTTPQLPTGSGSVRRGLAGVPRREMPCLVQPLDGVLEGVLNRTPPHTERFLLCTVVDGDAAGNNGRRRPAISWPRVPVVSGCLLLAVGAAMIA